MIGIFSETAINSVDPSVPSPWLAGLDLSTFPGPSTGEKIAQAAHAISADILSPAAESSQSPVPDPSLGGYIPFTTNEMVREAQRLGLDIKPWTVGATFPLGGNSNLSRIGEQVKYCRAAIQLWCRRNHNRL